MNKGIIFGAGNIGRGFIGQLFSQSGYEIVFADINLSIIDAINKDKSYPISIVSNHKTEECIITPVRGIDSRDEDAVAAEMLETDLIATAVGVKALGAISTTIAHGLKHRWEHGILRPINIIICENMLNAQEYMKEIITSKLDINQQKLFNEKVGLVEASIGRMVPVATNKQLDNPLRVFVEEYDELPVDKDGFKGDIPNIVNMIPYSPFKYYIHRKLYIHNMTHAMTAYLGSLKGYKYIWEAIEDPTIQEAVWKASKESAEAISLEHDTPIESLEEHAADLIYRFGNKALGDTIDRVGRDPIRKLSKEDRLSGAAMLCIKHGIEPKHIPLGIAAGLLYSPPDDEAALEIKEYIDKNGIETAITYFCSLLAGSREHELTVESYRRLKISLMRNHTD